ncbi:MAG: hypothetical protein QW404_02090, partial [Candidatus Nanoarchaeia archaeon]
PPAIAREFLREAGTRSKSELIQALMPYYVSKSISPGFIGAIADVTNLEITEELLMFFGLTYVRATLSLSSSFVLLSILTGLAKPSLILALETWVLEGNKVVLTRRGTMIAHFFNEPSE